MYVEGQYYTMALLRHRPYIPSERVIKVFESENKADGGLNYFSLILILAAPNNLFDLLRFIIGILLSISSTYYRKRSLIVYRKLLILMRFIGSNIFIYRLTSGSKKI